MIKKVMIVTDKLKNILCIPFIFYQKYIYE